MSQGTGTQAGTGVSGGILTRWRQHDHPREFVQWLYDDDAIRDTGAAYCIVCGTWVAEKVRVSFRDAA